MPLETEPQYDVYDRYRYNVHIVTGLDEARMQYTPETLSKYGGHDDRYVSMEAIKAVATGTATSAPADN